MAKRFSKYLNAIHLAGDLILLNIGFLLSIFILSPKASTLDYLATAQIVFVLFLNTTWYLIAVLTHLYNIKRTQSKFKTVRSVFIAVLLHVSSITFYIFATETYNYFTRELLLIFYPAFGISLVIWRLSAIEIIRKLRSMGYNYRNVVIVGYNDHAIELSKFFNTNPNNGFRFQGFFDSDNQNHNLVKGGLDQIENYIAQNEVDELYYALSDGNNYFLKKLMHFADRYGVKVKLLPDLTGFEVQELELDFYHHLPIITLRREPLDYAMNKNLKRVFDLAFSFVVIVFVLSWLVPILAILIKLDSRGPVFFKQLRSGKDGNDFWCFKFRTMYCNADADIKQAVKNDARITKFGQFLRKSNLDELPQFVNVLFGDMSVVGPRPHMLSHTQHYSTTIENYMNRHTVKPGVTGLAQAKGYRGETQDDTAMRNRVRVDLLYMEKWSFLLDLKVIILTCMQMIAGDEKAV